MNTRASAMVVLFPAVHPPMNPAQEGAMYFQHGLLGRAVAAHGLRLVVGEHLPLAAPVYVRRSQERLTDEYLAAIEIPRWQRSLAIPEWMDTFCDGPPLNPSDAQPQLEQADFVIFTGDCSQAVRWIPLTKPGCRIGFLAINSYWHSLWQLWRTPRLLTVLRDRLWLVTWRSDFLLSALAG